MNQAVAQIALSGVIGALSHALDIAEGQPPGHAVRSCLIGMRLAAELDLDAAERSDLFYALLLKDAGCSANANRMAALFATDDRAAKASSKLVDWTDRRAALLLVAADGSSRGGAAAAHRGAASASATRATSRAASWRRAATAAPRSRACCSFPRTPPLAIRSLDEHWDGRGMPDGLRGEEIPLAARDAVPRPDGRGVPRQRRRQGRARGRQAPARTLV